MYHRCVLCDEDYERGFKLENNFYCRRCFLEYLKDKLGVKEVC